LPASALLVIEIGRDDRSVLARPLAREKLCDPGVERLRHPHAELQLDVLELRLAELTPLVVDAAVLVGHHVGLEPTPLYRAQYAKILVDAVELEREVRRLISAWP